MAADDTLGRKLQDAEILVKKRAPKKKMEISAILKTSRLSVF